jgi:hypothetical protein
MQMKTENLAEYVRELHEFSATYNVPCGQPEDLKKLLERLATSEAFAADFGSMIRSVVFRENFSASPSELLNLVAVAWGGETSDRPLSRSREDLKELQSILAGVLRSGAGEPPPSPAEDVEDPRPAAEVKSARAEAIAVRRNPAPSIETPEKRERVPPPDSSAMSLALQRSADEKLSHSSPLLFQNSPYAATPEKSEEDAPSPRRGPGPMDILAFGLAGLVVALLATVTSLPVYRVHVSVFVPSASDAATAVSGSEEEMLRDGTLTQRVGQRLLLQPHSNPILRQDALSRALRDLDIGGRETILYASLVADTEHEVKIRSLQTPGVFEITCDSWSSQFAATFCNALVDTIDQQTGETSARKIDAAVSPGLQIYPRWSLQSILGLACGCILGALYGLIRYARPAKAD